MTEASAPVLEISVPTKRRAVPHVTFRLNGQIFNVRRPKLSIATAMVRAMEMQSTISEHGMAMSEIMRQFVNYIEPVEGLEPEYVNKAGNPVKAETRGAIRNVWLDDVKDSDTFGQLIPLVGLRRGRSRIIERLNDPDDELDIIHLQYPFQQVCQAMFERPTGPSPESSDGRRKAAGPSSKGTSRSTPARTSGTSARRSSSASAKRTR